MNRFTGILEADRFPNIYKYQYKYFHPTPVLPIVAAKVGNSWRCMKHYIEADNTNTKWPWEKSSHGGDASLEKDLKAVQDSSISRILPWRYSGNSGNHNQIKTSCSCRENNDNSRNLSSCSNILAEHAARANSWHSESFSVQDWNWNTHELCSGAAAVHDAVTLVQDEAVKSLFAVGKEQLRRSMDTLQDLNSRIHEISQWTNREREELKQNVAQAQELLELKQRISRVLREIEKPLEISKENLCTRKTRQGGEMVQDSVEKELLHEMDVFHKWRGLLMVEMEKVNEQIARLRSVRHEIEIDIEKKMQAKDTDQSVKALSTRSKNIGTVTVPHHYAIHSSPTSWIQFTQNILQKSKNERNLAQMLGMEVMKELHGAANDASNVWHSTNSAMKSRISEIVEAKGQIASHIQKLDQDITSLQSHIGEVQDALMSKVPVLQLAESRLDKRKERPGYELCRDQAMMSLHTEIHVLRNGIDLLKRKKLQMDSTLEALLKTRSTLERDLKLKGMALNVDQHKCLNLRICNPISTFCESAGKPCGGGENGYRQK